MASIKDDRGYNQGFVLNKATEVRMNRRADWMVERMNIKPNTSILEIGCGTGEVSFWIANKTGSKVVGTDLCAPFIEDAKQKYILPNLKYDILDFNKIEHFKNERFDYIIGNGILHHLYYNLDDALINLRALLKENGKIIFMEPNIYNPYCALIFNIPYLRRKADLEPDEMAFSATFVKNKLLTAGFSLTKIQYLDFLLPGIPEILIKPSIKIGSVIEKIPLINMLSQSILIESYK